MLSLQNLEKSSGSPVSLGLLILIAIISYILCLIYYAIYNLYFHPLHDFPGRKLWIAFPILRHIAAIRGLLDEETRALHEVHGQVVRTSPDELSFIAAQAWKEIYGHGHKQLPKWMNLSWKPDIITANDLDHTRFRKALSMAFPKKPCEIRNRL